MRNATASPLSPAPARSLDSPVQPSTSSTAPSRSLREARETPTPTNWHVKQIESAAPRTPGAAPPGVTPRDIKPQTAEPARTAPNISKARQITQNSVALADKCLEVVVLALQKKDFATVSEASKGIAKALKPIVEWQAQKAAAVVSNQAEVASKQAEGWVQEAKAALVEVKVARNEATLLRREAESLRKAANNPKKAEKADIAEKQAEQAEKKSGKGRKSFEGSERTNFLWGGAGS